MDGRSFVRSFHSLDGFVGGADGQTDRSSPFTQGSSEPVRAKLLTNETEREIGALFVNKKKNPYLIGFIIKFDRDHNALKAFLSLLRNYIVESYATS